MIFSSLAVGLGGFLGAISRLLLGKLLAGFLTPFWSICLINCIGCFLFGLFVSLPNLEERFKEFLLVGYMGSFTTYSSYAFLNFRSLNSDPGLMLFLLQIIVQTFAGLLLLYLGLKSSNYF